MLVNFLTLFAVLKVNLASIAGVTYMDDFDFDQRYRNLHECDPFYWHPLHLPEECAEMFEKLIRAKVAPYRVATERVSSSFDSPQYSQFPVGESFENDPYIQVPIDIYPYAQRPQNAMDKLFDLLKRDVKDIPSYAKITTLPYLGTVALYRQPVSLKTEATIKRLSRDYGNAARYR
ncbi:unnamed protein product [Leptosia nina]|uniref:Uncharacterized protein n=1 Tax=Leptosia nina TaxID=320188 RepID=A0AAV1JZX9_9NEOP